MEFNHTNFFCRSNEQHPMPTVYGSFHEHQDDWSSGREDRRYTLVWNSDNKELTVTGGEKQFFLVFTYNVQEERFIYKSGLTNVKTFVGNTPQYDVLNPTWISLKFVEDGGEDGTNWPHFRLGYSNESDGLCNRPNANCFYTQLWSPALPQEGDGSLITELRKTVASGGQPPPASLENPQAQQQPQPAFDVTEKFHTTDQKIYTLGGTQATDSYHVFVWDDAAGAGMNFETTNGTDFNTSWDNPAFTSLSFQYFSSTEGEVPFFKLNGNINLWPALGKNSQIAAAIDIVRANSTSGTGTPPIPAAEMPPNPYLPTRGAHIVRGDGTPPYEYSECTTHQKNSGCFDHTMQDDPLGVAADTHSQRGCIYINENRTLMNCPFNPIDSSTLNPPNLGDLPSDNNPVQPTRIHFTLEPTNTADRTFTGYLEGLGENTTLYLQDSLRQAMGQPPHKLIRVSGGRNVYRNSYMQFRLQNDAQKMIYRKIVDGQLEREWHFYDILTASEPTEQLLLTRLQYNELAGAPVVVPPAVVGNGAEEEETLVETVGGWMANFLELIGL
jgi:hypothetical protein